MDFLLSLTAMPVIRLLNFVNKTSVKGLFRELKHWKEATLAKL